MNLGPKRSIYYKTIECLSYVGSPLFFTSSIKDENHNKNNYYLFVYYFFSFEGRFIYLILFYFLHWNFFLLIRNDTKQIGGTCFFIEFAAVNMHLFMYKMRNLIFADILQRSLIL